MEKCKDLIWWLRWMGTGQTGEATYTRVADAFENIITENAALRRHIDNLIDAQAVMVKEFAEKLEELAQVKAERDAAVEDLRNLAHEHSTCYACINDKVDYDKSCCTGCLYNDWNNWKWRGPQKEV